MISNTLKFRSKMNMGKHPIISQLIKSFQIQRPVSRLLAPKWHLAFVLAYFLQRSIRTHEQVFFVSLIYVTSFLLTLVTAGCVSEIHAFAMDVEHYRFSSVDGSLTLRTQIGFLAKNQLPSKAPESITIPRL